MLPRYAPRCSLLLRQRWKVAIAPRVARHVSVFCGSRCGRGWLKTRSDSGSIVRRQWQGAAGARIFPFLCAFSAFRPLCYVSLPDRGRNATLSTLRTGVRGGKGRRQDPFGAGRQEDNENRWKQTTNCQHTPTHTCRHRRRNCASQSRDKG